MFRWLPYPFIRILLCFIPGILVGIFSEPLPSFLYEVIWVFLFVLLFAFVTFKFFRKSFLAGICGFIMIFLIGILFTNQKIKPVELSQEEHLYLTVIDGYPEEKERYYRYEAELINISDSSIYTKANESRVFLYVTKERRLKYGDLVLLKASFFQIESPKNPGEFNYRNFLKYKKIHHQAFISSTNIQIIDNQPKLLIKQIAYDLRLSTEKIIDKYLDEKEASVLKALIIGLRGDIDDSLLNAYASAGAIHVLAVSGLHVGIIYGLLMVLLGWLRKTVSGRVIFTIVILSALWFYALITGFSPSVFRAVTMFSFIVMAQAMNRKSSIYNTIAASAFILLCVDPLLIMQVGFQLSYLAVIGIVYLYPKIISLWEPENVLLDKVWKLSAVGIAAQIATFPLGMFYFHQFPSYFIISNLLVIPAATVILFVGIAFLLVSWWSTTAAFLALILKYLISFMNNVVLFIEQLPFSIIENIYVTGIDLLLLIGLVLAFIISFSKRSIISFYSFSFISLFFIISAVYQNYNASRQQFIQFYSVNDVTAIDFIEGKNSYSFISDSAKNIEYHTANFRISKKVNKNPFPADLQFNDGNNKWIQWRNRRIFIAVEPLGNLNLLNQADILYIDNGSLKTNDICKNFKGTWVIFGRSNRPYYVNEVKEKINKNINMHDLNKKALTINL